MLRKLVLCAALMTFAAGNAVLAQSPPIKRTVLQKSDVPGTNMESILGVAEISPGLNIGRHTHPGPEQGTVVSGELVLMVEGQPEKTIKAGDSYQIPPNTIHDARSGGSTPVKVIAVYTVPKGQPLATPAK